MTDTATLTVLFTDVVGSTELKTGRGDTSAHLILQKHFDLVRQQIELHSGQEVKTIGDSFMVSFNSARKAIECAISVQQALAVHGRKFPNEQVCVRIGMNTGEAICEGGDLFGQAVDAAARIVSEAGGGKILISQTTRAVIGMSKDIQFVDCGLFSLKGFPDEWRLYEVAWRPKTDPAESESIPRQNEGLPSVAVLPFADMSAERDQEYFCDGLTEELINGLTQLKNLRVVARTSSFSFKGEKLDVQEIGRRLNVQTVLEGSVRKAGSKLRITAQLVKVSDGYHLWSERYDRVIEDVFQIQDEITAAIVEKLKVSLSEDLSIDLAKRRPVALEAYQWYLRGRYFWNKQTEGDLTKAIGHFEKAIERSPDYALAYVGLADSYILLPFFSSFPPKQAYPNARMAALKALDLDKSLFEAHSCLAHIKTLHEWDWQGAEREFTLALELSPGYATAYHGYSLLLMYQGRFEEAIEKIQRALEIDPLSVAINREVGNIYYYARDYGRAIAALKKTVDLDDRFSYTHLLLGAAYEEKGARDQAMAELEKEKRISEGHNVFVESVIPCILASMGQSEEAARLLEDLMERSREAYIPPSIFARLYLAIGETEKCFEWLQRGFQERDQWLCFLKIEPAFDGIRRHPRFDALLKKIGLGK